MRFVIIVPDVCDVAEAVARRPLLGLSMSGGDMTTDPAVRETVSVLTLIIDDPPPGGRLLGYALAWREEIAGAHRTRLRTAVLEDIAAGLSVTAASQLTGLSRMTLHKWLRDGSGRAVTEKSQTGESPSSGDGRGSTAATR